MNRALLKKEAKEQLWKNLGTLILSGLLLGLLTLPGNMLGQNIGLMLANLRLVTKYNSAMSAFVNTPNIILFCLAIAATIITPVLTLGVHHIYLKASRGGKPQLSEIYSRMSQFWSAFFTSLLSAIFVSLQLLLLIIPGIIALYSYSMAYFVLVEHPEFGAMQAIKESKRIMKGHKFELFVLEISFIWWILLSIITFGIALVYVIPYMEMSKARFYDKIKSQS